MRKISILKQAAKAMSTDSLSPQLQTSAKSPAELRDQCRGTDYITKPRLTSFSPFPLKFVALNVRKGREVAFGKLLLPQNRVEAAQQVVNLLVPRIHVFCKCELCASQFDISMIEKQLPQLQPHRHIIGGIIGHFLE